MPLLAQGIYQRLILVMALAMITVVTLIATTTAIAVTFISIIAAAVVTVITSVIATVVATVIMSVTVLRRIDIVIPAILDEINSLAAGIIRTAVFRPVFCMSRRHAQINRLFHIPGLALNNHRLRINQLGLREAANINAAIKTRLANIDRYPYIRSNDRKGGSKKCCSN